MSRCNHSWSPLIVLPAVAIPDGMRLDVASVITLCRLDRYQRCRGCDRLAYVGKRRRRRRMVSSPQTATRARDRAARFQEWIDAELGAAELAGVKASEPKS